MDDLEYEHRYNDLDDEPYWVNSHPLFNRSKDNYSQVDGLYYHPMRMDEKPKHSITFWGIIWKILKFMISRHK